MPPPFAPLRTPRLLIRGVRRADATAHFAYASDPEVTRWVSWGPFTEPAQSEAWAEEAERGAAAGLLRPLGITLADSPDAPLIGHLGLFWWGKETHVLELGFALGRAHWGQGYATEAAGALAGWALRERAGGLLRLEARCAVANAGSARVLERLGFVREGTLRGRGLKAGRLVDQHVYGLLASDPAARTLAEG
ncbi:GNAT family N-acetyltransferase [Aggregicoccus sp. 17bor-14]|uniref:GNAT family N-acetyltransferase n=1 Tax=Myxococcaceae TaxID=31 RepID=UPI00129C796D|nr:MULTISPECIES: GNAT family protein [Myxococcaceae]MBF5041654.1 GNAT family N-acetyltransferase [Simulacricoccus sp. 17bor-14]MRI87438.1 GNAT family N-acetyltransferase [Aggregicoccus sp. 17bor-14]